MVISIKRCVSNNKQHKRPPSNDVSKCMLISIMLKHFRCAAYL